MSEHTCPLCGDRLTVGPTGEPFTTITVSYHDPDRKDFSESVCSDCGDELLADVHSGLKEVL